MDHTAKLRSMKGPSRSFKKANGDGREKIAEAEGHFAMPYGRLRRLCRARHVGDLPDRPEKIWGGCPLLGQAKMIYPQEAQAYYLGGFARLQTKDFAGAYQTLVPMKSCSWKPTVIFFKGLAQENMGNKPEAAQEYNRYLRIVQEGKFAQYATSAW